MSNEAELFVSLLEPTPELLIFGVQLAGLSSPAVSTIPLIGSALDQVAFDFVAS